MFISPEYKKVCEEMIIRNLNNKNYVVGPNFMQGRVKEIIGFINQHKTPDSKILDIGSGAYMPIVLGATHACDVVEMAGNILEKSRWKGEFQVASCDSLPYEDKSMDIAICTEVIEHLPYYEVVARTFQETERVAKKWVITTPRASKSGFRDTWNVEETHVQFFTTGDIRTMMRDLFPDLFRERKIRLKDVNHYVFVTRV